MLHLYKTELVPPHPRAPLPCMTHDTRRIPHCLVHACVRVCSGTASAAACKASCSSWHQRSGTACTFASLFFSLFCDVGPPLYLTTTPRLIPSSHPQTVSRRQVSAERVHPLHSKLPGQEPANHLCLPRGEHSLPPTRVHTCTCTSTPLPFVFCPPQFLLCVGSFFHIPLFVSQ